MSSKNLTPATKEEAKPALVPKLRFSEFRGKEGWAPSALASACDMQAGKFVSASCISEGNKEGLFPCYGGNGLRGYTATYTHDGTYPLIGRQGALCGNVRLATGQFHATEHAVVATPKNQVDVGWLYYSLDLLNLNRFATGQAQPGLSVDVLENVPVAIPPTPAEQQKIAECLSSVDELMAAQARKVDALKTHKKGLMQQLFPREGETQPRLRFPEFRKAPAWEVKAIGDVFKVTRGEVLAMTLVNDEASNEMPYPVYSSQTKNKGLAGYYSDYLYQDAITWTTDGANAGDVNFRPGRFYCTNVCGVLLNTDGHANECVAALLNSVTRGHVSYVGNPKLMNGVMAKIEIPFPSVPEQQRIASYLSSLDALITAETQKHEALKTHKKGLMQQLFPTPEEPT
jgi:type I restriction enzyme S subunit